MILRAVIGMVLLVHGSQKLFGFDGVAGGFEGLGIPLPPFFAVVVTLVEFLVGAALILGLCTRLVSIPLAIPRDARQLGARTPTTLSQGFGPEVKGWL